MKFKEEWLFPNAVVPVDAETTQAMVEQIKRMMDIIGGMALTQKNAWVGLTDEEIEPLCNQWRIVFGSWTYDFAKAIEAKLKEKNT